MPRSVVALCLMFLIPLCASGQQWSEKLGAHLHREIESEYLAEKRGVEIYLPPSYQEIETKRYPVMYVMDGQEYFLHPVAYQRMLRFKDKSPEFIVVGIQTDRKKRRKLLYEDSDRLTDFLMKELIPYIDHNYRTLKEKERVYFGWEMSAGFGLEILRNHPNSFNGFFMASPTHLTEDRIATLKKSINEMHPKSLYLYFSKAPEESYLEESLHKIDSLLSVEKPSNILWKIETLLNEDHYTTPLKTMNNGLRDYFQDYNTLRFYTLKEFDDYGSLEDIKDYYEHRGKRYGISADIHRTTKHFLLFNAMKEDNFERFEVYASEFNDYFQDPTLEIWAIRFGNYFAKYHKDKEAMEVYEYGLKKFPESAAIYSAIGDVHAKNKNKSEATMYYKQAIAHAEKSNDSNLKKYRENLEKL